MSGALTTPNPMTVAEFLAWNAPGKAVGNSLTASLSRWHPPAEPMVRYRASLGA